MTPPGNATPDRWWRRAVTYQVYIRSFADSDGDGLGDIAGLRSRLDYLRDLGVDAIWVSPWYPSPQADAGYDVADYCDIDPVFGTLAGADALVREAHDHGLRVLLDIVPNHTSEQHPWFQAALAARPGSPERARYVFRAGRGANGDLPPTNWSAVFGGPAWTRVAGGDWYLHIFSPQQPDLNWDNTAIHAEFEAILRFWFDRGVDGFRVDAAKRLVKDPAFPDVPEAAVEALTGPYFTGHPAADQEGVHEIYSCWRRIADSYTPPRVFVSEAWVKPAERLARYVRAGELHTTFNFDFLRVPWDASAMRAVIDETLRSLSREDALPTWVLSNHDVIRPVTRYGRQLGHESDLAGIIPTDLAQGLLRARAAALLELALPGNAYIYQGDELGLEEVEDLPEEVLRDPTWERSGHSDRGRDGSRVPIPWSGSQPPFGFGQGGAWLPQPPSWSALTVEAQDREPSSTLNLYRKALRLRRSEPALGEGRLAWLDASEQVLAFRREPGFVCVVNCDVDAVRLPDHDEVLLSSGPLPDGRLAPDQAAWLRVGPPDYRESA